MAASLCPAICCGLDLNQHTLSGTSPSKWHQPLLELARACSCKDFCQRDLQRFLVACKDCEKNNATDGVSAKRRRCLRTIRMQSVSCSCAIAGRFPCVLLQYSASDPPPYSSIAFSARAVVRKLEGGQREGEDPEMWQQPRCPCPSCRSQFTPGRSTQAVLVRTSSTKNRTPWLSLGFSQSIRSKMAPASSN
jgi:hypothetical protein